MKTASGSAHGQQGEKGEKGEKGERGEKGEKGAHGQPDDDHRHPVEALSLVIKDSSRILGFIALALTLVLLAGGLFAFFLSVHYYDSLRATDSATCAFWKDIGTVVPGTAPPDEASPATVRIILDARAAYAGDDCGTLPPPSQQLTQLEQKYGIRG